MDSETTQTGSAGLRERKKLATKQALALAAMKLAVQRGLENVRVEDIADAANVSRRTFTNYFASKEEAIASLSAGRFARASQAPRGPPPGGADGRFPGRGVRRPAPGRGPAGPRAGGAGPDADDVARAAGRGAQDHGCGRRAAGHRDRRTDRRRPAGRSAPARARGSGHGRGPDGDR